MSEMPGLAEAADALYGGDPDDFVARRDALAKEARARKDRELAAAIKALRRPTVGAWFVNLAVRAGLTSLRELLRLGRELRAAQADLDFARVVALGSRRADVERRVLADLRAHLTHLGVAVSPAALEEVRSTLRAALTDADAAAAVEAGRLARPLEYGGMGALGAVAAAGPELDARAVAGPDADAAEPHPGADPEPAAEPRPDADPQPDAQPEAAAAGLAEPDEETGDDDLAELEREAAAAEAALAAVRARRERLLARCAVDEARQRLEAAEAAWVAARADHDRLRADLDAAADRLAAAAADRDAAAAALAAREAAGPGDAAGR